MKVLLIKFLPVCFIKSLTFLCHINMNTFYSRHKSPGFVCLLINIEISRQQATEPTMTWYGNLLRIGPFKMSIFFLITY